MFAYNRLLYTARNEQSPYINYHLNEFQNTMLTPKLRDTNKHKNK